MEITIPYQIEFSGVIASFIEETGICYGADPAEKLRLRLLGEEAFSFIIAGIPDQDFSEAFRISCTEMDDGLVMQFSNHGRPMDVREIHDFSVEDAEGTAEGLSLKLLRTFSDKLSFTNLGRDGWELLVHFKIKNFRKIIGENRTIRSTVEPESIADYQIRRSTDADVPGIINLVYNTYRYSYAKSFAYNPELFREAILSGKLISLVVATGSGKIIGHNAIILESEELGEAGMAMVDPEYRRSRAFIQLARATREEVIRQYPKIVVFIKAVTSHKSSQAFMSGFTPCLLELSVYKHASFVGMQGEFNPRESLIYGFTSFFGILQPKTVFLPEEHFEMASSLFGEAGKELSFDTNSSDPETIESILNVKKDTESCRAILSLAISGQDLGPVIRKLTRELQQDGMVTLHAIIPTHCNQSKQLDKILEGNGYFFSGIKPNAAGNWDIIYTNLLHQKFDFDRIHLFSSRATELCEYIKALYFQIQ